MRAGRECPASRWLTPRERCSPSPDAAPEADLPSLRGRPAFDAALRGEVGSLIASGRDGIERSSPTRRSRAWLGYRRPAADRRGVRRGAPPDGVGIVILGLAVILAGTIGWNLGGRLADLYQRQRAATTRAEAAARDLERVSAESERRRRFLEGVIASAPVAIAILRGREYRHETLNGRYQALRPDTPMPGRGIADVFPTAAADGHVRASTGSQRAASRRCSPTRSGRSTGTMPPMA